MAEIGQSFGSGIRFFLPLGFQAHDEVGASLAFGIGVAGEVEPEASPLLAIAGGIEQAVDQALVGAGPVVVEERVDLFWRGGQAGEVEGRAAKQGGAAGFWRERDVAIFEFAEKESVDGIADAVRVPHSRRCRLRRCFEGPGQFFGRGILVEAFPGGRLGGLGSVGDPLSQRGEFSFGDLLDSGAAAYVLGRHLVGLNFLDQRTGFGFAGYDDAP